MYCKELEKEYTDKSILFKELKEAKDEIIAAKKTEIKSCEKGQSVTARPLTKLQEQIKGLDFDDDFYYIAVNTTNILDSHGDLHVSGIWNKTVKDQQGKVYLVLDHELKVSTTVAKREYVEMFIVNIPFSSLGLKYEGETEALIYKVRKDKVINQIAKEWLESGDKIEASVRMQYVNISLALNSDNKEDVEERKVYNDYINQVVNKNDFEEINYFWVVKEAKNLLESSLVLFGSNHATGNIKKPSNDTSKQEPSTDTLNKDNFDYQKMTKYLKSNF